jgi:hypothetical protein
MAELAASYYAGAVDAGLGDKYFPAIIEVVAAQGRDQL